MCRACGVNHALRSRWSPGPNGRLAGVVFAGQQALGERLVDQDALLRGWLRRRRCRRGREVGAGSAR